MGIRQFDTVTPADTERSLSHRAAAPEPEVTRLARQGLPPAGIPASGRVAGPLIQARALALASGGRLARAGTALLQLQRQHSNRYVQRVIQYASQTATAAPVIQTKLMLGAAGDRYEREADRVAEEVVGGRNRGPAGYGVTGRTSAMRRSASSQAGAVHPEIQQGIQRARAGGQTISEHVRAPMERAFEADFRGVRLHTDDRADWLNRVLGARAFTTGKDIFLRRGEYGSDSHSTRRLLAHELAHVVQQDPSITRRDGAHGADQQPSQAVQGSMIQCKFPAAPYAGDLEDINRLAGRPHGTLHYNQGMTTQPSNYVAPLHSITVEKDKKGYVAKVQAIGAGDMGDCEATYLKAGAHDCGYLWDPDPLLGASAPPHLRSPHSYGLHQALNAEHVILNVSARVARGSKAAEQEHLNDNRYAYGLTLGAAEEAIEAVAGQPFQGVTRRKAERSAEARLQAELSARSNHNLNSVDRTTWEAKYAELARRSGTERDGKDYHLQTLVENTTWNTGLPNMLSSKRWGHPVHHVDVAPGPQFRLGVPSRDVIDPNANRAVPTAAVLQPDEHQDNE